jgi:hypothetical protein
MSSGTRQASQQPRGDGWQQDHLLSCRRLLPVRLPQARRGPALALPTLVGYDAGRVALELVLDCEYLEYRVSLCHP